MTTKQFVVLKEANLLYKTLLLQRNGYQDISPAVIAGFKEVKSYIINNPCQKLLDTLYVIIETFTEELNESTDQ